MNRELLPVLRRVLDAIEADPACPVPYGLSELRMQMGFDHERSITPRTDLAALLRACRRAGLTIRKGGPNSASENATSNYDLHDGEQRVGYVYTPAELTCERVQVDTRTVTRAIKVTTVEEVGEETVEVPVYEWRCGPVLAPEGDPVLDAEERGSQADPDRYDDAPR